MTSLFAKAPPPMPTPLPPPTMPDPMSPDVLAAQRKAMTQSASGALNQGRLSTIMPNSQGSLAAGSKLG